ncbi:MAG: DUF6249 domain-containing protein [Proteobacteria bacterium]|nr:DUF6249 domain-containing protein [Pseudomonadota bacterium]
MNEGVIVAISLPLMAASIVIGFFLFLYKSKVRKLDALVKIVELGGNVDPEMMKMLSTGNTNYKTDYRYGLIWLAVGIPLFLGVLFDDGADGGIAFTLVPILVGIAFLISGKYKLREPD